MRVCIVSYEEYLNIPYINNYEEVLMQNEIKYDVLLWDRRNCMKNVQDKYISFKKNVPDNKLLKLLRFLQWRRFCINAIKAGKYDKLIVLTTVPAVLLSDLLLYKYKEKYIFDIRDYTYEKYGLYEKIVNLLVDYSSITFISSRGFRKWLNSNEKIYLTHNITNAQAENNSPIELKKPQIILAFIGGIRFYEENCILLKKLKNSAYIQMAYIGKHHPGFDLPTYCRDNEIYNVFFKGAYHNEQKPEIYKSVDLINSVYGNEDLVVTSSLPNKLYDCILFKKPIIVSSGTYLAEIVEKYNLGIAINLIEDDIEGKIREYVNEFDEKLFLDGCQKYKEIIDNDMKVFFSKINSFVIDGKDNQ